ISRGRSDEIVEAIEEQLRAKKAAAGADGRTKTAAGGPPAAPGESERARGRDNVTSIVCRLVSILEKGGDPKRREVAQEALDGSIRFLFSIQSTIQSR